VEDFDGFLKILKPGLKVSEYVLLILYARGKDGASFDEIESWVQPKMRANLRRALTALVDDKASVHQAKGKYILTRLVCTLTGDKPHEIQVLWAYLAEGVRLGSNGLLIWSVRISTWECD
jgi:hypothetical protein